MSESRSSTACSIMEKTTNIVLEGREIRVGKLIKRTQEVAQKFGFVRDKRFSISELNEARRSHHTDAERFVLDMFAEVHLALAESLAGDAHIQLASLMNAQKMIEKDRRRKDGSPYYIHPESVSQQLLIHAPENWEALKQGIIGALLHDYLEEGDGAGIESLEELRAAFGEMGLEFVEDLVLLTEPNFIEKGKKERPELDAAVNYDALEEATGYRRKQLETVAFGLLMGVSRLMQLVVPVDKLDNVGDCDVVARKKLAKDFPGAPNREYFDAVQHKVAETLAKFVFYGDQIRGTESQNSKSAILAAVQKKIEDLSPECPGLKRAIGIRVDELQSLLDDSRVRAAILSQLRDYYQSLKLDTVLARLEKI